MTSLLISKLRNICSSSSTPQETIEAWFRDTMPYMPFADSEFLTSSIYLCRQAGFYPPAEFMKAWTARGMEKMRDFKTQDLSNIMDTFARLQYHPPVEFMQVWTSKAMEKIREFTPKELSSIMGTLAQLNYYPSIEFMDACIAMQDAYRKTRPGYDDTKQQVRIMKLQSQLHELLRSRETLDIKIRQVSKWLREAEARRVKENLRIHQANLTWCEAML